MAICKFFASGSCRNGNRCTYEHISPQNKWGSNSAQGAAGTSKYNETSLKQNLTEERPQWKLSVYGPAKEEPNLIVGVDKSVEEDRLAYYTSMRTTGNASQYLATYEQAFNQVESQVNAIINNPSGAIQHYEKEKSNHSGPFGGAANNAPFAPFTNTGGAFGSSSTTSAFGGGSAFGSAGGASAFGQPSAFGAAAKPSAFGGGSAFGSTNALGGGGSAFGSTSALGSSGSAFGSTSALGGGSAFGSTSALGGGGASAFGQPSAFGTAAAKPSAFGGGGSAFGSTSALGSGSAFGSTSALGSGGSAFGASASTPAFGSTTAPTSAFGSTSALGGGGAFGQTSALGSTSSTTMGAFGTPASSTANAFGSAAAPTNNIPNAMSTGADVSSTAKQSDLEAFQAPQFAYRGIPEIEPPIQLR
ncbi:hypothetical protein MBANPS3_006960 [Mucor bainieri]